MRRDARQQYRLLQQLIAAGDEEDVLDLISSMWGAVRGLSGDLYLRVP